MIVGILSDTHLRGPDERLEALLAGPLGSADVILHAGDHTGVGVVDHLEFLDPRPYHGVAGNMDGLAVVARLPSRRVLTLGGCTVGLVHGWGAPKGLEDRVVSVFDGPLDLVVFGHSHRPTRVERGSTVVVNPGSAFHRRGVARCTVARVELGGGRIRSVEFVEAAG